MPRPLPHYQVDAFAEAPFTGNPAAVCLPPAPLDAALMQAIARENNLSETAFAVKRADGAYDLRWFTPEVEVDLCGHATLATAHVLLEDLHVAATPLVFHTRSGRLVVDRDAHLRLVLDFPARPPQPWTPPAGFAEEIGVVARGWWKARDVMALLPDAEAVRRLAPDLAALARHPELHALSVTAPGSGPDADVDFVSRFFAPAVGVPEDPVTGSAHCHLVPFWAARLEEPTLRARQVSARGGELWCELRGDRVRMAGHAITVVKGSFLIPD